MKVIKASVVVALCLLLGGCIRLLLPTSTAELRQKAKVKAQFIVAKDYADVYRELMRMNKQCLDFSRGDDSRHSVSNLDRDAKKGEIRGLKPFGTLDTEIQIAETAPMETSVQIWTQIRDLDTAAKKWLRSEHTCV